MEPECLKQWQDLSRSRLRCKGLKGLCLRHYSPPAPSPGVPALGFHRELGSADKQLGRAGIRGGVSVEVSAGADVLNSLLRS